MDLELREDLAWQRLAWRVERVGWVLLALVLVGAVAGVFGNGLISGSRAATAGLAIEYPRVMRAAAPAELRVVVDAGGRAEGRFSVWLDAGYLGRVSLERITPEPARVLAGAQRTTFEFDSSDDAGPVELTFEVSPRDAGVLAGRIGRDSVATEFRHFVYP